MKIVVPSKKAKRGARNTGKNWEEHRVGKSRTEKTRRRKNKTSCGHHLGEESSGI